MNHPPDDEIQFAPEAPAPDASGRIEPWKVLVVDDEEQVHAVTKLVLGDFTFEGRGLEFLGAFSGAEGAERLRENPDVAVVLLDVVMENEHAGLDLVKKIRKDLGNRSVRIVLRTGQPGQAPEKQAFVGYDINDYRTKSELTSDKLFTAMMGALRNFEDINRIEFLYRQVQASQLATVVALADLAEYKDQHTGEHVLRIKARTDAIARRLVADGGPYADQLDGPFLALVGQASILHDVGKVGIPDRILRKPAKLDPDEWEIMKTHTTLGQNLLEKLAGMVHGPSFMSLGARIAGSHHEKWDGTGYPRGLAGTRIPLEARIVAVADVFDALRSDRPYKEEWGEELTITELQAGSGTHFDPIVLDAFLAVLRDEGDPQP